jgi:hypothetical protein
MSRAAKPGDITSIEKVALAIKRKMTNVSLNLNTGAFEVKNKDGAVVKTLAPAKGSDAVYVVNKTTHNDDLQAASDHMYNQRTQLASDASDFETRFAEKQDTLIQTIEMWHGITPGASRNALSLQIGRLQNELAGIEKELRNKQYKYREVLEDKGIKRRVFVPSSNDDRVMPHPVFKLNASQTSVIHRVLPIKDSGAI